MLRASDGMPSFYKSASPRDVLEEHYLGNRKNASNPRSFLAFIHMESEEKETSKVFDKY